jgi:hypothetical protein
MITGDPNGSLFVGIVGAALSAPLSAPLSAALSVKKLAT